ncbi:MAG: hypothetical protein GX410_08005 [Elusimicrobia bacterium]|nr:hypothetical protein [Elusimicrobiota bacterium]
MRRLLAASFVVLLLSGCGGGDKKKPASMLSPDANLNMPPLSGQMFELYSWSSGGEWYFSVIEFSPAPRAFADISSQAYAVRGVKALMSRLSGVPQGAQIYWNFRDIKGVMLPPEETMRDVAEALKSSSISLDIIRR